MNKDEVRGRSAATRASRSSKALETKSNTLKAVRSDEGADRASSATRRLEKAQAVWLESCASGPTSISSCRASAADRAGASARTDPSFSCGSTYNGDFGGSVTDNRRTSTRHAVSLPATLTIEGAPTQCTVLNLSLGGALVSAERKVPMGFAVTSSSRSRRSRQPVDVGATVRWADTAAIGSSSTACERSTYGA